MMLGACHRVPDGILSQEEMASLMADTYMGEGVVDMNGAQFASDSARLYLRESIYKAHGLSRADVERSFDYYGNHIEDYIKVLERSEEILRERQQLLTQASARQMSISGDSVDIWPVASHYTVNQRIPSRYITFEATPDTTWHNGDSYELRYKLVNGQRTVDSHVFVDYAEGVTRRYDVTGRSQGYAQVKFEIDSTLTPLRLYGYIDLDPQPNEHFQVDSISLIRLRARSDFFYSSGREILWNKNRNYRKEAHKTDTAATAGTAGALQADEVSLEQVRTGAGRSVSAPAHTLREMPAATAGTGAVGRIRQPKSRRESRRL